jgi:hypothetical protein
MFACRGDARKLASESLINSKLTRMCERRSDADLLISQLGSRRTYG